MTEPLFSLRMPRALSVALLGLLLAFNAVSAALNPAQPGVGDVATAKALTARAPLIASFREPVAVIKIAASRLGQRHDDGPGNDPALPPAHFFFGEPTARTSTLRAFTLDGDRPSGGAEAYRARAPPFAA